MSHPDNVLHQSAGCTVSVREELGIPLAIPSWRYKSPWWCSFSSCWQYRVVLYYCSEGLLVLYISSYLQHRWCWHLQFSIYMYSISNTSCGPPFPQSFATNSYMPLHGWLLILRLHHAVFTNGFTLQSCRLDAWFNTSSPLWLPDSHSFSMMLITPGISSLVTCSLTSVTPARTMD